MSMRALILPASLMAAAAAAAEPIVVDGFHADPLSDQRPATFSAPPIKIHIGADVSRYSQHLLSSPPPTPPEIEQARQHHQRALTYLRQGEQGKAMLEVRDGLTFMPDNPSLLSLAGTIAIQTGQLEDAAGYYRRWLDVEPANLAAAGTYIGLLIRLSRIAEAEAMMRRYEPSASEHLAFRFHRLCLELIAERPVADDPFWRQRTLEEIAQLVHWLYEDGSALARVLGAPAHARLCELALGPRAAAELPRVYQALVRLLRARETRQTADALNAARELTEAGLTAYGVRAVHADLLEQSGSRAEALAMWRQIISEFSELPQAWVSAAHVFLRNGRTAEALSAIQRAKELVPRDPVVDFLLASALALSGRTADAHPIYVQLVSRWPRQFQRWLESDAVFEAALDRMPNKGAIMRRLEIPPELE